MIAYKILYLKVYFVFKRSLTIRHILQGHIQQVPVDLSFHFQNCKHFLEYFVFYVLTAVYTEKAILRIFVCLFAKLQRQKEIFVFTNRAQYVKAQYVLFANKPFLRKMLVLFFCSNIPLYIEKLRFAIYSTWFQSPTPRAQ